MSDTELSKRVERIENKMDDLVEIMISLARTDEKICSLMRQSQSTEADIEIIHRRIDSTEESLEELSSVVSSLDTTVQLMNETLLTIKRIVYGTVTIILTGVVMMLFQNGTVG